jgi:hypothetical protein
LRLKEGKRARSAYSLPDSSAGKKRKKNIEEIEV